MTILKTTMKEIIISMSVKESFFSGIVVDVSFRNNLSYSEYLHLHKILKKNTP